MSDHDPDWLESESFDVAPDSGRSRRNWPRWWPVLPLSLVALLAAILILQKPSEPLAEPPAPPILTSSTTSTPPRTSSTPPRTSSRPSSSTPATSSTSISLPTPTPTPSVVTRRVGEHLWGVTGKWELFTVGSQGITRIQPAAGIITNTLPPDQVGNGPDSVFPMAGRVLVMRQYGSEGYQVVDGEPASKLPASLQVQSGSGGVMPFPGPDPKHLWVQRSDYGSGVMRSELMLLNANGKPERSARLPDGAWTIGSDGRGGLLIGAEGGGVYRMTDGGYQRISTGTVRGLGPRTVVLGECDDNLTCGLVGQDLLTGERWQLPAIAGAAQITVSPDGVHAAMVFPTDDGQVPAIELMNLRTGARKKLGALAYGAGLQVAFSPDGSLMFAVGDSYRLQVFDRDGNEIPLGIKVPAVDSVVVRPG